MSSKVVIIIGILSGFFIPIIPYFLLIGLCVFLDTVTGIIKSKKNNVKVISDRLFQGIAIKTLIYSLVLTIFYIAEHFLINEFLGAYFSITFILTKIMTMFFMGIELYSIDENIREFNNDKGFRFYFIKFIKLLKKYINELKSFKDKFDKIGDRKKEKDND